MKHWFAATAILLSAVVVSHTQQPPRPQDVRAEILQLMSQNNELYEACLANLRNQHTNGYRAHEIFRALDGSRPVLRMTQGTLTRTHMNHDLAIEGDGFLVLSNGEMTRNGSLTWIGNRISVEEFAVMGFRGEGRELVPVEIPPDGYDIEYSSEGRVLFVRLNGDGKPESEFTLAVGMVRNPTLLERSGKNLKVTPESGPIRLETAGRNGAGVICQHYLEQSNVDPLEQQKTAQALRNYAGLLGAPPRADYQPF